jgi:DNA mismatch repair protein MutL
VKFSPTAELGAWHNAAMRIRKLPEGTINRIAAGEVVERPASAVKELVENAIDAGATQVDVVFRGGGKTLIRISDNGCGMEADDLKLAAERHATSKLSDDALINIATLGFRGEALPSIASVARLSLVSRASTNAHELIIDAGRSGEISPATRQRGTDVEVRDLFYATPARLKFLKSDRSETAEALDVVRRLALAHPQVGFAFTTEDRRWLDCPNGETRESRIARIMGHDFIDNAVLLLHAGEGIEIGGLAGLPTFAKGVSTSQFAFVNGRPVRDKLIAGAIRGAYADVMPSGRYPAIVLLITCPPDRVDVNVHPAKTEIRFRDQGFVRGLIVSAVKRALSTRSVTPDTAKSSSAFHAFRQATSYGPGFAETTQSVFEMQMPAQGRSEEPVAGHAEYPLGIARAQLHGNYILAQTEDGMIMVDQHAAHERIVYERLKAERESGGIAIQPLLVPQVIDLDASDVACIEAAQALLKEAGLAVEAFGATAVIVREIPAALANADMSELMRAIADDVMLDTTDSVPSRMNHVLATFACHHSVRSGRVLRQEEMNALLRQMEHTPNAGECNHGRPTFIKLSLVDIERLFGRT